ncbi:MAG: Hsp20/alpha crystallin family protein [Williamsia herbipolensis]|nr:Hsp20/alpha crystallin family protein [Williamsia herbipolensis]
MDSLWHSPARPGRSAPSAELTETDEQFTVDIDLPGVERDNVTLDVTGRRVLVHATRTEREKKGVLRHTTRTTGDFAFELTLPTAIDDAAVTATMADGVLTVTLPKSAAAKTTRIAIA